MLLGLQLSSATGSIAEHAPARVRFGLRVSAVAAGCICLRGRLPLDPKVRLTEVAATCLGADAPFLLLSAHGNFGELEVQVVVDPLFGINFLKVSHCCRERKAVCWLLHVHGERHCHAPQAFRGNQ